jgi:hypothetical protein
MTVRPAVGGLLREGRSPLVRLLGMARPLRARLLVAVAAGAAATGCGVALLAVSGFLPARASQHPSIITPSLPRRRASEIAVLSGWAAGRPKTAGMSDSSGRSLIRHRCRGRA